MTQTRIHDLEIKVCNLKKEIDQKVIDINQELFIDHESIVDIKKRIEKLENAKEDINKERYILPKGNRCNKDNTKHICTIN